jgi:hypothetical protein
MLVLYTFRNWTFWLKLRKSYFPTYIQVTLSAFTFKLNHLKRINSALYRLEIKIKYLKLLKKKIISYVGAVLNFLRKALL